MRDAKPLAGPPDATAKAHAKDAGAALAGDRCAADRLRRWRFRAGTVRSRRPRAGAHLRSLAEALGGERSQDCAGMSAVVPTERRRRRAQHRLHGRRRGDRGSRPVRRWRGRSTWCLSIPARGRRRCSPARWSAWGRARARCWSRAIEGPAGCDYQVNTALELSVGDEAHVDHIKITVRAPARCMSPR